MSFEQTPKKTTLPAKLARSLGALALAGALAATAAAQAPDAQWQKVIEAARKEGSVVMYNGAPGSTTVRDINRMFEARYGIRVQAIEGRPGEIRERLRAERASGRAVADVFYSGRTLTDQLAREGALEPSGPLPNAKNFAPPAFAHQYGSMVNHVCYGILVNTRLVKPEDEPRSWNDLTDPKWKGKIISDDLRTVGGGGTLFTVGYDVLGPQFHEKLGQQNLHFSKDMRAEPRRVARGEYPIYIPQPLPYSLTLKGLPVKMIVPQEGCPVVTFDIVTIKDAPHPNAARLLADFYLSKEAQTVFAREGFNPVIEGITELVDPEIGKLLRSKVMGSTTIERRDELLPLAKKYYP